MELPVCKACKYEYTYEDRGMIVCSSCGFEWDPIQDEKDNNPIYKDSSGNILVEGDTVALIKDLKLGSSSNVIKRGTKGKNIQLGDYGNDHDISCKVDGHGALLLKTSVVKKV